MKKRPRPKSNFTQIPNLIFRNEILSVEARCLFGFLSTYDPIFPSYSQIQKLSGLKGKARISKAIKELQEFKIIRVAKGGNLSGQSNQYFILPESGWLLPGPNSGD